VVDGHLAAGWPPAGDAVIRVTHVSLPPGLSALARRGPDDELSVYVSDALPPERQRAAVRVALRASRRPRWRSAMLPVPSLGLVIAAGLRWLRGAGRVLRVHWAAFGTAATVAAATSTAVYLAAVPHGHQQAGAARPPAPVSSQPAAPARSAAPRPGRSRPPRTAPTARPQTAPKALATAATRPSQAPSPPPTSAPTPSASRTPPRPSPSPAPHKSRHCIRILGIRVCVGVGT